MSSWSQKETIRRVCIQNIQKKILGHPNNGGCDTTSAIFRLGKGKVYKKITSTLWTKKHTDVMQNEDATSEEVIESGLEIMCLLFDGKAADNLNALRYTAYGKLSSTTSYRP